MSIKSLLNMLPALLLLIVLSGCITTEVEITLNPDGSGTLEYTSNFDRAPQEMREQIRQRFSDPNTSKRFSKETILEHYPEPHFKLRVSEDDIEQLRSRTVLQFNDINALLIKRKTADLGLKSLDFKVDGDVLVFSVKEEKVGQPWPEKYDNPPGLENISVVNAVTGEKISFFRELTSKTQPADWTGRLAFPGHSMVRNSKVQVFHDYPVVQMAACDIRSAQWSLRRVKQWSALELKLNVTLPTDPCSYVRWENPVVLSGDFRPTENHLIEMTGKGEFKEGRTSELELKLPIPAVPAKAVDSLTVRVKAFRSSESSIIKLGPLKPNTEYTAGDLTITTDDLDSNRVGFRATGTADRLKSTWLETHRGNRFELKKSSWSGTTEKRISHWESFPLEGASLCVEVYNTVEPCYIDMEIPALDLTQRAWRVDDKAAETSNVWKPALQAEHPELFTVSVPPVDQALFESKENYKAYFQGLEDQQIMPALVEVVDYMMLHDPEKGQYWIQDIARTELVKRTDYLSTNRKQIAEQLFAIYLHTPKEMICLSTFFTVLQLQEYVQILALQQLGAGNVRFAEGSFFGRKLSPEETEVLKIAFSTAETWMDQTELLEILEERNRADRLFVTEIASNPALSEHVRGKALRLLMKQKPFPSDVFSSCLSSSACQGLATQALNNYLTNALRSPSDEQRQQTLQTVQPFIPMLEDLAEQLKTYDAQDAIKALEKIQTLENEETP